MWLSSIRVEQGRIISLTCPLTKIRNSSDLISIRMKGWNEGGEGVRGWGWVRSVIVFNICAVCQTIAAPWKRLIKWLYERVLGNVANLHRFRVSGHAPRLLELEKWHSRGCDEKSSYGGRARRENLKRLVSNKQNTHLYRLFKTIDVRSSGSWSPQLIDYQTETTDIRRPRHTSEGDQVGSWIYRISLRRADDVVEAECRLMIGTGKGDHVNASWRYCDSFVCRRRSKSREEMPRACVCSCWCRWKH